MSESATSFEQLGLNDTLLKSLKQVGYEVPSPIQALAIPLILQGRDILGQAQTGTGKTAAFALPLLQMINTRDKLPQVLVLAPTRELAIQVSEAFQSYAHFIRGFHVLPIYGGASYDTQIRALKRGVQVVVGTPGRVMDHMRKGTLKLDNLKHLVLDEADEMLRMGFIDDVEWVLSQIPKKRQISLFSATMPREIAKVANTYLNKPEQVRIEVKTTTAETIRQRYWPVSGVHKLDATTRILEAEPFDAMIIFVRTKTTTVELADKLLARGFTAAALNGDISQVLRERTVNKLKKGQIDILVATDVAARGLDVSRISHVLNYDIPYDTEGYVHRIGRTGRAGRTGEAILFVANREVRMLRSIEKATGQKIEVMRLPSAADINQQRVVRFTQRIDEALSSEELQVFRDLTQNYLVESQVDPADLVAALAMMAQGDQPLFLKEVQERPFKEGREDRDRRSDRSERKPRRDRKEREKSDVNLTTFRLEVGHQDGAKPGSIVGAIANEANMDSKYIGHIKIHDNFSTVDLPVDIPKATLALLKKVRVCQRPLNISLFDGKAPSSDKKPKKQYSKKNKGKAKTKDKNDLTDQGKIKKKDKGKKSKDKLKTKKDSKPPKTS